MAVSKTPSALEKWVLNKYGGTVPSSSIKKHTEELVRAVNTIKPPVRLSLVAKHIGLNPKPIFQFPSEQGEEGGLNIVNGAVRIFLQSKNGNVPKNPRELLRKRFTYAHELAHALFYDLDSEPQKRAAPMPRGREEEVLCNYAAGQFLVPQFLLESVLDTVKEPSSQLLRRTANMFEVSLESFLIQAEPFFSKRIPQNKLFMASLTSVGVRWTGMKEPRCIACYIPHSLKQRGLTFLHPKQRIKRIKNLDSADKQPWSLLRFFENAKDKPRGRSGVHKETLQCPNGEVVSLESVHTVFPNSNYVWTEATILSCLNV